MHGIADAIEASAPRLGSVRLVAVDGPSGAGKTTVARAVVERLRARGVDVGLIGTDEFATWDDPVSWWPRLAQGVLDELAHGRSGRYRRTDWSTGVPRPGESIVVAVPEVLVVEGVSAGRRSVRPRLSLLCWVECGTPAERLEHAVARDGARHREHFRRWQRFEAGWFAVDRTREHADVVVDRLDQVC